MKAKAGRPVQLTASIADRLCEHLRAGESIKACAEAVEVSERTLHRWLAKARSGGKALYKDIGDAYSESEYALLAQVAEGDTEVRTERDADGNITKTIETEKKSWRIAVWLLEKRFPAKYGDPSKGEAPTAPVGGNANGQNGAPNYQELAALLARKIAENENGDTVAG